MAGMTTDPTWWQRRHALAILFACMARLVGPCVVCGCHCERRKGTDCHGRSLTMIKECCGRAETHCEEDRVAGIPCSHVFFDPVWHKTRPPTKA